MSECAGCKWSIISTTLMCEDNDRIRDLLRSHSVVQDNVKCTSCGNDAVMYQGFWRCQRRRVVNPKKKKSVRCTFKMSLMNGSLFHGSHLPQKKLINFFILYVTLPPPRQELMMQELSISDHTYSNWATFCREVCIYWAAENCNKIGGNGKIVEIDEAKFGKRKYHRGRLIEGQWVFGGVERGSKKSFYVAVPARNAQTLTEVILKWILPGTTIISDCWKAYSKLGDLTFEHLTVNHSVNFVDPDTGAHTQNIERSWRNARGLIPRYGRSQDHYEGYLAEFQFKTCVDTQHRLHEFLIAASFVKPEISVI